MNQWLGILLSVVIASALIFGPLVAWLADERGRDARPWFALGALLGPVALIAVGFSPRKEGGGRFKLCVECQEAIPSTATTCPLCATDLIEAEASERRVKV